MSSGSAAVNVYRNMQTKDIVDSISKNEFDQGQQLQIQECIRAFNIELKHIQPLKQCFIKGDKSKSGFIQVRDLVTAFAEMNF